MYNCILLHEISWVLSNMQISFLALSIIVMKWWFLFVFFQESETGLYICLNTFLGWGKEYVSSYSQRTGNYVFLHLRRIKKEVSVAIPCTKFVDSLFSLYLILKTCPRTLMKIYLFYLVAPTWERDGTWEEDCSPCHRGGGWLQPWR